MPRRGGGSGVPNLSYLASTFTFGRNVEAFRELRDFDELVLMHGPSLTAKYRYRPSKA